MNYVEHFNLLGTEAKQIPCVVLDTAPTTSTEGAVGLLCMDSSSEGHDLYKCVAVNDGVYTWEKVESGAQGEQVQADWSQMDEIALDYIKNKPMENGISENSLRVLNGVAGVKGYRIKGLYESIVNWEMTYNENWYISFSDADAPQYPLCLDSYITQGNSAGYGETPPVEFRGIKVDWAVGDHLTIMNANNWDDACEIIAEMGDEINGYYYEVTRFPFNGLWVQYEENDKLTTTDGVSGYTIEEFNDALNSFENKVELHDLSYCAFNINQPSVGLVDGGMNAFTQGMDSMALLEGAVAFGYDNKAIGKYSFTVGRNNIAYYGSIAAGRGNTAGADMSAAIGQNNTVNRTARNSAVEGVHNELNGYGSHGEGAYNVSYASMAHVEGNNNTVGELQYVSQDMNTNCAHVEGSNNTVRGKESNIHIEGKQNQATGASSHTEGSGNTNNSHFTHVEGGNNTADTGNNNAYSHVEGYQNTLTSLYGHIEGIGNTNAGEAAHVEGRGNNNAGSTNAHIEGANNNAIYNSTDKKYESNIHIEGRNNTASSNSAHVEGSNNTAGDAAHWSHVGGRYSQATHEGAIVHGYYSSSTNAYQAVFGKYACGSPDAALVVGGNDAGDLKSAFEVIVNGGNYAIKVGTTTITEAQLQKILQLIEE